MPPNTVKVDRTTDWGNPFYVAPEPEGGITDDRWCMTAAEAVSKFRWFQKQPGNLLVGDRCPKPLSIAAYLRGKNLACWCKLGTPCHADVLLEIANA